MAFSLLAHSEWKIVCYDPRQETEIKVIKYQANKKEKYNFQAIWWGDRTLPRNLCQIPQSPDPP